MTNKAEQPTITPEPWIQEFIDVYIAPKDTTHVAEFLQSKCRTTSPSAQDGLVEDAGVAMLMEGAQDAVDAFKTLRIGMLDNKAAIEVIDAHIDELEYALSTIKGGKS